MADRIPGVGLIGMTTPDVPGIDPDQSAIGSIDKIARALGDQQLGHVLAQLIRRLPRAA